MLLTDSKAARLALLLQLYYDDGGKDCTPYDELTVKELLHDLEISTFEPEALEIIQTATKNIAGATS